MSYPWQNDEIAYDKRQWQQDDKQSNGIGDFGMSNNKTLDETSRDKDGHHTHDDFHSPFSTSSKSNNTGKSTREQPTISHRQAYSSRYNNRWNLKRSMQEDCQERFI